MMALYSNEMLVAVIIHLCTTLLISVNLVYLQVVPAKPQYSNPELQLVADEIEELNASKLKLESEIQQKEASIRLKNNEIKNLQVSYVVSLHLYTELY